MVHNTNYSLRKSRASATAGTGFTLS